MNRRGSSDAGSKAPYYLGFAIFLIPLFALLIMASFYYVESFTYLDDDVRQDIYAERAMTCFAVRDVQLERTYLVIDKNLITDDRLSQCFSGDFKGILVSLEDGISNQPVMRARNTAEHVPDRMIPFEVLYLDNGVIKRGIFKVSVSRAGGGG